MRTDLAAESDNVLRAASVREYERDGFKIHEMTAEKDCGDFRRGRYVTVGVGRLWVYEKSALKRAEKVLSEVIGELVGAFVGSKKASFLVVCLGNRHITSDALGPLTAEKLIVTRHLRSENGELLESLGGCEVAVITPGVTGETGVETLEAVSSAVKAVKPDLVICIDALAARSSERLATTVQVTSVGISPGSGVGNHRSEISLATLGVPVVSIGVPTVVESSTLVCDALENAGMGEVCRQLSDVLENQRSFFVTPKNADVAVTAQAELIARAINRLFFGIPEL